MRYIWNPEQMTDTKDDVVHNRGNQTNKTDYQVE